MPTASEHDRQSQIAQSKKEFKQLIENWESYADEQGNLFFTFLTPHEKTLRENVRSEWRLASERHKENGMEGNVKNPDYLLKHKKTTHQARELLDVESAIKQTIAFRRTCAKHYQSPSFILFLDYVRIFTLQRHAYKKEQQALDKWHIALDAKLIILQEKVNAILRLQNQITITDTPTRVTPIKKN